MKKILFLTNIPAPYTVAFFNELGKSVDLTVLYERESASNRNKSWTKTEGNNYTEIFLKGINMFQDKALCFSVVQYLNQNYDFIVVGGYSTPTGMLAISYMSAKKIPFLISTDGGYIKNDSKFKTKVKSFFISRADACFSSGDITTDYLIHYGARKEKIYKYPFTSVMEQDISAKADECTQKKLRKKIGIKEEQMIVSVGSYIYRKGYDILIKAMQYIPPTIGVYLIGGKPTDEYNLLKKEYGLNNLHFIDFKKKEELDDYYKAADLFVLPTREDIWGLVINEAMAFGLPVITTDRCVAGLELIQNGKNGFIVPHENAVELGKKITNVLGNRDLCKEMSDYSLDVIRNYTIEKMADRYQEIFDLL